jgi:hypothetical protein
MRREVRTKLVAATILLLAATAGCVPRQQPGAVGADGAVLRVDNQSSNLVTIYALRSGVERVRLGQARALQVTELRIPPNLAVGTQLNFIADALAVRGAPISPEIVVWPGDVVEIVIPPR